MDELDEFNEAPHSLRSEANSFHEMRPDDMERIDLDDDDDDDDDQNQIINILDRTNGRIETNDLISTNDLLTSDSNTINAPAFASDHIVVGGNANHFNNNINNSNQNQTSQSTYLINPRWCESKKKKAIKNENQCDGQVII